MYQKLFDDLVKFPNPEAETKYSSLIGLDDIKTQLIKESEILLNPKILADWSIEKHGKVIPLVKLFYNRYSLFIFSGDIGTGKTTLAETFGDYLARQNNFNITLFSLSLNTRGGGNVGDMTRQISNAFSEVRAYTDNYKSPEGAYTGACILIIDEADALAQSRDLEQMQHEERAGVDSLIQGIDSFTKMHLPVITVMCTNRLHALDAAIQRRAIAIFKFVRPTAEQRLVIFQKYLEGTTFSPDDLQKLVKLTGENETRQYGYTYSDIIQIILPALILDTFPQGQITLESVERILQKIPPSPPIKINR
jgi:SpoVK/Ycf46/Vps4 family AAA+-type ATPase